MRRFIDAASAGLRRLYGAHPLHLLLLLGCFALAGYVAATVAVDPMWPRMAFWFAAAVLAHDLVLFPLYALVDRATASALRQHRRTDADPDRTVPVINHLRVPTLASGLLFLLFFPGIVEQGRATFLAATGQTQQPYLARWLVLAAAFFLGSALIYAIRRVAHRRESHHGPT